MLKTHNGIVCWTDLIANVPDVFDMGADKIVQQDDLVVCLSYEFRDCHVYLSFAVRRR
jgi:hypothetical protein